jgi:hypothetical protein
VTPRLLLPFVAACATAAAAEDTAFAAAALLLVLLTVPEADCDATQQPASRS